MPKRRTLWLLLLAAAFAASGVSPAFGVEFERLPEVGADDNSVWQPLAPPGDSSLFPASAPPGTLSEQFDWETDLLRLDQLPDADLSRTMWSDIWLDHQHFYSYGTL